MNITLRLLVQMGDHVVFSPALVTWGEEGMVLAAKTETKSDKSDDKLSTTKGRCVPKPDEGIKYFRSWKKQLLM